MLLLTWCSLFLCNSLTMHCAHTEILTGTLDACIAILHVMSAFVIQTKNVPTRDRLAVETKQRVKIFCGNGWHTNIT